ncbi:putative ATP binding protein [Phyllosticta citriasiana]|uniref:GPN-loop GTPase n=1 Tax=Phyllosticta citriasiana TaxID=595635 RepID=A0ABR1KDS4_9PEZI
MATTSSEKPVTIVCVGMAGSGKTTFMQRINSHLHAKKEPPYVINLDPAVRNVPFDSNIDIRDSVNYKEVMKQYNLGPNGGIITSLNLFATKVDQILGLLEKRTAPPPPPPTNAQGQPVAAPAKPIKHILVDTPGQIEVFVWSASGDILLGSLASSFPTVIAYVIDTPRTASTSTFMSNMLYACSILYKTKLPMILVMNKTDVKDAEFAKEWMTDFEAFQAALREEENGGGFGGVEGGEGPIGGGSGYMGSLLNSMSLMLDEFYRHLSVVGVSSMTGQGVDEFFEAVKEKAEEFERDYKPELERRREEREKEKVARREQELDRLMKDMSVGGAANKTPSKSKSKKKAEAETVSDIEDEDDEEMGAPEEDSDAFEDDEEDGGIQARYQKALKDDRDAHGDDMSFARYVTQASMR